MLVSHFCLQFLMPLIKKDLEYFQFPCLLFFFKVPSLLLWSPCLFPDLINFQPVLFQFVVSVTSYIFFYSSRHLVSVYLPNKLYFFFFVFHLFLGPMVLVLDTFMFARKFYLLILSYLATKDVPLDKFTLSRTAPLPSTIFLSYLLVFLPLKIFVNIGFATSSRIGSAVD